MSSVVVWIGAQSAKGNTLVAMADATLDRGKCSLLSAPFVSRIVTYFSSPEAGDQYTAPIAILL